VGRIISKDVRAYSYLPESIAAVPQGADMLQLMTDAGFCNTRFRRMTFGTCTIYTAHRPF
jgi:demethylmenaquinone methyltransferase/2-methoxy-6-polyprenyl-1,4-benzoquinol methylase